MGHSEYDPGVAGQRAWNAGRKLGAKRAFKPQQVWAIRFWLDHQNWLRDRALFDLAIDSKLRGEVLGRRDCHGAQGAGHGLLSATQPDARYHKEEDRGWPPREW